MDMKWDKDSQGLVIPFSHNSLLPKSKIDTAASHISKCKVPRRVRGGGHRETHRYGHRLAITRDPAPTKHPCGDP